MNVRSPTLLVLQVIVLALFGIAALAVACQALRNGRATFRGEHFDRGTQPVMFRLVVATYVVLVLLILVGIVWICVLPARGQSAPP